MLLAHLRTLARANLLANRRLHSACLQLTDGELAAPRTGFFPSLRATLNHILIVDWYYVAALHGEADMRKAFVDEEPFDGMEALATAQRTCDLRLVAWCESADDTALTTAVAMDRGATIQRDLAQHVLLHLFTHQIHHRGQAHAMLSGTRVAPPQLDKFLMPSEAHYRVADLAAVGWTERDLFGKP